MQFGLNCKKVCWRLHPKPQLPEQSSVVNYGDSFILPDRDKNRDSVICFSELMYLINSLSLCSGKSE